MIEFSHRSPDRDRDSSTLRTMRWMVIACMCARVSDEPKIGD
jgi:hypothetical protein